MSARPDISDFLIHFTSGESLEDAFECLRTIVSECRLLGGTGMVRGGYRCVCFSEAPLPLRNGLVNPDYYSRYRPFGLLFKKQWIFEQGGHPVIYQPPAEFDLLPETLRWRHVSFEPPRVDFTWEREWRICCDELPFDPGVASIVLPSEAHLRVLVSDHEQRQDHKCYLYSELLDVEDELLRMYREDFPWRVVYIGG